MRLIKGILLFLNILAVLALVFVKIGSLINPNTFVLLAYASLGLFPFLIINIGFILFWALFRKWYFLISLAAVILFSSTVKSAFPVNFAKPEIDTTLQKITLLSYNTMNTGMMKKHKPDKPNKVIQYILDSDADIVCLQEFAVSKNESQFQEDDMERIFKKYPYKHIGFQLINKWNMDLGVATFSKFPIVKKKNIDFKADYNMSIFSDIVIGKDTLRVINNHLESNRITAQDMKKTSDLRSDFSSEKLSAATKYLSRKLSLAYKVRANQAVKISEIIKKSPYKVISCGDFNDVPASYTYVKTKGNLKDAFKESGNGTGWTFDHQLYRFRIDYIMYDNTFLSNNFKKGKLKSSDHYPISADIYLPK
ncbi:MAG: endonuclease/exonuclease/phosphatase family protein [Porphyromonadaceae bacterium]|nr:endonuclease/exonuclease/phosphatase family protein [Porphyromonadaceae bacterium]